LEPQYTRLKDSESHADAEREGIRITISGGINDGIKQKAVVELVCDPNHTGLECHSGNTTKAEGSNTRRAEDDGKSGKGSGDNEHAEDPQDPNADRPLQLVSYKTESTGGKNAEEISVLRLSWKTKYACENQKGKPDADRSVPASSHWGWFTWFIIM